MNSYENAIEAVYPLSPAQEGILFHASLSADAGVYFIQRLCTLPRDLNVERFKDAWRHIMQRHTILRTAFLFESAERPLQVVGRQVPLPWEEEDWRMVAPDLEQQRLAALLEADRVRGFELTRAPLMRLRLVSRQDGSYYLLWSFHHAILDGWSWPLVLKEVYAFYAARGRAQLPIAQPYQSYIAWLQRQDLNKAERFWRTYLQGVTALTLPGESVKNAQEAPVYARCQLHLPSSLLDALQTLLQRYHLTVNTVVCGAWALLLSRYSGESDVVFGTAVSGRPPELPGVEAMVGMFINTLPVRMQVVEEQSILSWLQELQQQQAELRQYEYSPLVQIQKWSGIPRETPLFENILVCNAAGASTDREQAPLLEMGDVQFVESTNYPLEINVEAGTPFLLQAVYEVHRFEEQTIQRLLSHLQTILFQMCTSPQQRLGSVTLLSEAEQQEVLVEWNATAQEYPNDCLHHLLEAQARLNPGATALVYEGTPLTYQELDQRANRLAWYLRKRGVGPEVLVGLCIERSLEMIVGLIGILKAGGAYVPLDPEYPTERLGFILENAACPLVITQEALLEHLPIGETRAICLDRDWGLIEQESSASLPQLAHPENLAYVIYTSGSTGKPKGVQIAHRAVVNYLHSTQRQIGMHHDDTWVAITTICFDIAAMEIFLPLLVGARVVLASHQVATDAYQLAQLLQDTDATILQATPATWQMLLAAGWSGKQDLKALSGGEALPPDLALQLLTLCAELWNFYGPTETTIYSATTQITDARTITLGHPIANTQAYVLDAALRPVPVGVEGQLYLGGVGLARGYLKRPELTAERFIPDAFGQEPGGHLYQTGDRVRYRPDGSLEYLGRADYQVKLRGFRIELGEIETALRQHPLLRDAVVVVKKDASGHQRLIAYVVAAAEEAEPLPLSLLTQELQSALHRVLPDYMVPSLIVPLDALPLTPNRKVDRRALPDPGTVVQQQTDEHVEPRNEIEQQLATIWKQVLRVGRVGVHDSFFALGGDSILSIRVVARVRQRGLALSARDLFRYPTVAQLAQFIEQNIPAQPQRHEAGDAVPLTPLQHWFFEQQRPDYNYWNQAFLFRVKEPLEPVLLRSSLRTLLETHDALRLRFHQEAGMWKQFCPPLEKGSEVPLSVFTAIDLTEAEQVSWVQECVTRLQASLDLDKGPILRVALFDAGPNLPQFLLFVVHHLAVDITSWRILLSDWQTIYQQLQANVAVDLAPVPTSFQHWATRLESYARSLRLMRERSYWFGLPWDQVKSIPVDRPHGENTEQQARTLSATLSVEETHILLQEASRTYHMLTHEVLLAALAEMHARWTGSRTLLVDMEGHGREDIIEDVDLSRTTGWFTTLVPVCLDISEQREARELLTRVKEQVRDIPHGGIGYGLLRYCSQNQEVRQKLAALPQSQMVFHYKGHSATVLDQGALLVPAEDVSGSALHPDSPRSHLLAFEGQVAHDQLRVSITYSAQLYSSTTIEQLLEWYLMELRAMIAHCQTQQEEYFTPQDFPEADLDQTELDNIIASLYQEMES